MEMLLEAGHCMRSEAAARLETAGIPTVLLTRDDFTGVVKNAMSGLGFDTDASMVTFPIDLFMAESDLTLLETQGSEFAEGLIDWKPVASEIGLRNAPMITISERLRRCNEPTP